MKLLTSTIATTLIALGMTSCATKTSKANAEKLARFGPNGTGGFTYHAGKRPMKPCSLLIVHYSDSETGNGVTARSNHSGLVLAKPTSIVGAEPGTYLPTTVSCFTTETNGDFKTSYNNSWDLDASSMDPIVVVPGKITVVNSLNFRALDRDNAQVSTSYMISEDIKAIQDENPQYEFIGD